MTAVAAATWGARQSFLQYICLGAISLYILGRDMRYGPVEIFNGNNSCLAHDIKKIAKTDVAKKLTLIAKKARLCQDFYQPC